MSDGYELPFALAVHLGAARGCNNRTEHAARVAGRLGSLVRSGGVACSDTPSDCRTPTARPSPGPSLIPPPGSPFSAPPRACPGGAMPRSGSTARGCTPPSCCEPGPLSACRSCGQQGVSGAGCASRLKGGAGLSFSIPLPPTATSLLRYKPPVACPLKTTLPLAGWLAVDCIFILT